MIPEKNMPKREWVTPTLVATSVKDTLNGAQPPKDNLGMVGYGS